MDLDPVSLRYFATVADLLHFGRAARALGVDHKTLSRRVNRLEADLGTALFVRPSDRTELTDAGRDLRERIRTRGPDDEPTGSPARSGAAVPVPLPFRVAIVPGVIPAKWIRTWAERRPDAPIEVVPVPEDRQVMALRDGPADVAFIRLPVEREGLHMIPLYAETAVLVLPTDHELTLLEEVSSTDLADEHLLEVGEGSGGAGATIALVAAGVGLVVVPQSIARLHHRKDLTYRPVTDREPTTIALAWPQDRATDLVEEFVGIVRGRTARSSRGRG